MILERNQLQVVLFNGSLCGRIFYVSCKMFELNEMNSAGKSVIFYLKKESFYSFKNCKRTETISKLNKCLFLLVMLHRIDLN